MGWILLILGLLGFVHAVNALSPRKRPVAIFLWSFFGSWLTIELVWHHLALGVIATAVLVSRGALDDTAGVVGLIVMAVTLLVMVRIAATGLRTAALMHDALAPLSPSGAAPRFPRVQVVLPLLFGRRRGVHIRRHVSFTRQGGRTLRLDVTVPSAAVPGGGSRRPALMQIHGGGWVIGDKREQGLPLLGHMSAQGWVGFNVNYRLSPGVGFPDHLIDLKRGLAWIREHADDYDVDPDFICVTGGSAGGHLTALMALTSSDKRLQPGFELADTSVAAAIPFYGIYDFTPGGTFGEDPEVFTRFLEPIVMKAFLEDEPEKFRDASPIHRIHEGAPPFLVVHGDHDTLAPVEDARSFVAALRQVSTQPVLYAELAGAQHAFEIFPSVRAVNTIEGVERFLSTLWEQRCAARDASVVSEGLVAH